MLPYPSGILLWRNTTLLPILRLDAACISLPELLTVLWVVDVALFVHYSTEESFLSGQPSW